MAEPSTPQAAPSGGAGSSGGALRTDAWSPRPDEELRFCFFEGLLETQAGTRADHEAAVRKVRGLELGDVRLDIDGRRARLLFEEGAVAGSKLDDRRRAELLAGLQEFHEAAGDPRQAESTLRCTEVFQTAVRETLFQPLGAALEPVCRVRTKVPSDEARAPRGLDAPRGLAGFDVRTIVILLALLFVGFGASAWSSGWVDRVLAHDAAGLAIERGPFEGLLDVQVEQSWGRYVVTVRRGERFPADPASVRAALDAETTTAGRASVNAVVNGEDVYLVLESSGGKRLGSERISLRPLLAGTEVRARLWGRIQARTIRVSLDDGKAGSGGQ